MSLTKEKKQIFASYHFRIYEGGQGIKPSKDGLVKRLFVNYRVALFQAVLNQNFHTLYVRHANWKCYKEYKKKDAHSRHQSAFEGLNIASEKWGVLIVNFSDVIINAPILYNVGLAKLTAPYQNLTPLKRYVIDYVASKINGVPSYSKSKKTPDASKASKDRAKEV